MMNCKLIKNFRPKILLIKRMSQCDPEEVLCKFVPYLPTACQEIHPEWEDADLKYWNSSCSNIIEPPKPVYLGWLADIQYQNSYPDTHDCNESQCVEQPKEIDCCPVNPCDNNGKCNDEDDDEVWIELCSRGVSSKMSVVG